MIPRLIEPVGGAARTLAEIHATAFTEVWGEKAFADLLAQPGVFALSTDAGFILCRAVADEAEIVTLAVSPAARRQGQARALIAAARELLTGLGVASFFLEVARGNKPARALYDGLGFEAVGLRKAYYADGSDAVVMRLNLNS